MASCTHYQLVMGVCFLFGCYYCDSFDISEVAAGQWVRSACYFVGLTITWSTSEVSVACDGSKFVLMRP